MGVLRKGFTRSEFDHGIAEQVTSRISVRLTGHNLRIGPRLLRVELEWLFVSSGRNETKAPANDGRGILTGFFYKSSDAFRAVHSVIIRHDHRCVWILLPA
jgi:hypothetical protein